MPDSSEGTEDGNTDQRQPCAFFLKTGSCAFGDQCKFIHPADQAPTQYNSLGLPLRPGEPECAYYAKNLHCGYGASCKFHHSEPALGWMPYPMMEAYGMRPRSAYSGLPLYSQVEGSVGLTPNFAQGQSRDQMLMPAQPAFSNQIYSNPQIPGIAQPYAYAGLPSYGLSMIPQSMAAYHQSMSNLHLQQMGGPSSMPASVYQQTRYVSPQIQAMMQSRPGLQSASSQSPRPGLMSQHMRSQLASWPTPASPQILQRQGSSEAPQIDSPIQSRQLPARPQRTGTASGGPSRSRLMRDKQGPQS